MQKNSNHIGGKISISELFRYRTKYGELQCHRLNVSGDTAGELLLKVLKEEKALSIEEVFIERKFRNAGLGSMLLSFAETTARTFGFRSVELRAFSTDPLVTDAKLGEWYMKRGYKPGRVKMSKKIHNGNFMVIS